MPDALRWSPDRTRATTPDGYVVEHIGDAAVSGFPLVLISPPAGGWLAYRVGRTRELAEQAAAEWIEEHRRERTTQPKRQGALL